jgi:hypothetical protein
VEKVAVYYKRRKATRFVTKVHTMRGGDALAYFDDSDDPWDAYGFSKSEADDLIVAFPKYKLQSTPVANKYKV